MKRTAKSQILPMPQTEPLKVAVAPPPAKAPVTNPDHIPLVNAARLYFAKIAGPDHSIRSVTIESGSGHRIIIEFPAG